MVILGVPQVLFLVYSSLLPQHNTSLVVATTDLGHSRRHSAMETRSGAGGERHSNDQFMHIVRTTLPQTNRNTYQYKTFIHRDDTSISRDPQQTNELEEVFPPTKHGLASAQPITKDIAAKEWHHRNYHYGKETQRGEKTWEQNEELVPINKEDQLHTFDKIVFNLRQSTKSTEHKDAEKPDKKFTSSLRTSSVNNESKSEMEPTKNTFLLERLSLRLFSPPVTRRTWRTPAFPFHHGCPSNSIGNLKTSLVFVKVHKSASTTVANMLARYALRHALHVALPRKVPGTKRCNYFDGRITSQDVLPIPQGQHYQVLFNHMVFHRQDLQRLLSNDSFYFAIMRSPEERFLSSFTYYHMADYLTRKFGLITLKQAFLLMITRPDLVKFFKPEIYNSLAGDTGLHFSQHRDIDAIQAHIQRLEKDLNLVMVVEYFDESLVLLKRLSCLSMRDIVYRAKNARPRQSTARLNLTPKERTAFEKFQMADVIIYRHFYRRFWELVHMEGTDFFQEVHHFRKVQRTVEDFCGRHTSVWDAVTIPPSVWNEDFTVTARECQLMGLSELDMQRYLVDRAIKLYTLTMVETQSIYGSV